MANSAETANISNNQDFEPLDRLQMRICGKNGVQTTVAAIHTGFMERRYFVHFKMPPAHEKAQNLSAEEEEWLEYMLFLEEDLHWLLKLPYHRFWSQAAFDEGLHRCLESYLSQAPRDYDVSNLNVREELLCAMKKIHKLVFLVYLRMSTYKESKIHHITPEAYGDLIYDNYLFDIPKIMDLCALYGIHNSSLLTKMVHNIFSTQPKYRNDLDETSKVILMAFNNAEENLYNIPRKQMGNQTIDNDPAERRELALYHDVINYIADVSVTIHAFLENFSSASQEFYQNGAVLRIPTFYEQVFPFIEKEISRKSINSQNESIFEEIKKKVVLSKTLLIKIFRNILNYTCIQNILDSKMSVGGPKMSDSSQTESFLDVFMELIVDKTFLCDYNQLYPFETDLEFFTEIGVNLDADRVNYIFFTIHDTECAAPEKFTSSVMNGARPKVKKESENVHKSVQSLQGLADILRAKESSNEPCPEEKEEPSAVVVNSLIQSVLDILPTYGEGFVEKCLEYFAYDSEQVINAVLSNSLPDQLQCLDRNLKRAPRKAATDEDSSSILSERRNVFDNDEFDIFSRKDVNMENIHIGKKNKTPDTYESLQQSKDSEFLKNLTLAYEDAESNSEINLYEDEYDDTYDSMIGGLKEPILEDVPEDQDTNDEPGNEEEAEDMNRRPPNSRDFCINPEILRERAQKRRESKEASRYNRGGRPADQPQSRQQKDRHKSNVGNHNRRKQSDFKKSRGMGLLPPR